MRALARAETHALAAFDGPGGVPLFLTPELETMLPELTPSDAVNVAVALAYMCATLSATAIRLQGDAVPEFSEEPVSAEERQRARDLLVLSFDAARDNPPLL